MDCFFPSPSCTKDTGAFYILPVSSAAVEVIHAQKPRYVLHSFTHQQMLWSCSAEVMERLVVEDDILQGQILVREPFYTQQTLWRLSGWQPHCSSKESYYCRRGWPWKQLYPFLDALAGERHVFWGHLSSTGAVWVHFEQLEETAWDWAENEQ